MINKKIIAFFILTAFVLWACKKETPINSVNKPTAYNLVIPSELPTFAIPSTNPLTVEGIALGRKLFYDPILSADNTQSCSSCHNQANAFTDTNRFSKGITGELGNRNAMPIFNLGFRKNLFWDGRASSLEDQALQPIENPIEMNAKLPDVIAKLQAHNEYPNLFEKAFGSKTITKENLAKAIAQFERTILSANSKYDKYKRGEVLLTDQEAWGEALFVDMQKGDCFHCHTLGAYFTDGDFKNNGLDIIPNDLGRFNITQLPTDSGKMVTPTLRNIELTPPYMHDGRFKTLEEVLEHYNIGFHKVSNLDPNMMEQEYGRMTKQETNAIIAFLKTLTDNDLATNPKFSKP